jgi:coenzyme F420-0:L-glutamate ligase/coenzyme F420-1:gamma-L-glutamate ligase
MILSTEESAFADLHRVGRLATASADGTPHVVPFCYARVDDRFYFVIDDKPKRGRPRELKRLRNIAANPRVAFVVDEYAEDWSRLAYLMVYGRAELVDEPGEYERALEALRLRYPQYRAMTADLVFHPMVRITAQRVHFWRARG